MEDDQLLSSTILRILWNAIFIKLQSFCTDYLLQLYFISDTSKHLSLTDLLEGYSYKFLLPGLDTVYNDVMQDATLYALCARLGSPMSLIPGDAQISIIAVNACFYQNEIIDTKIIHTKRGKIAISIEQYLC